MAVDRGRVDEEGVVSFWFECWRDAMDTVDTGMIVIY